MMTLDIGPLVVSYFPSPGAPLCHGRIVKVTLSSNAYNRPLLTSATVRGPTGMRSLNGDWQDGELTLPIAAIHPADRETLSRALWFAVDSLVQNRSRGTTTTSNTLIPQDFWSNYNSLTR